MEPIREIMTKRVQFKVIGVLSVESHLVKFAMMSMTNGDVVASSEKSLSLIRASVTRHRLATACCDRLRCTMGNHGLDDNKDEDENDDSLPPEHGHVEQDARLLWRAVEQVIGETVDAMNRDDKPMTYVQSLAIVNEMGTLMTWDGLTGAPLHNAVHWTDVRMASPGRTGAAAQWLLQRAPAVSCAGPACRMGTMDAWLMWKLTDGQTYATDVTNASYTGLMDVAKMTWDPKAMLASGLPEHAWPAISRPAGRNSPAAMTVVLTGRLFGLSVHAIAARPGAALYGQRCRFRGQMAVTLSQSTAIAVGAYAGLGPPVPVRENNTRPWPVIAYCEPGSAKVMYGQMAASRAPAVLGWLRDMTLADSEDGCVVAYESFGPAAGQPLPCIVQAPDGLPDAPYCRADARTVVCGIDASTDREHFGAAAVDAIVHSVADLVTCVTWGMVVKRANTVAVDGEFSCHEAVMARLADVTGSRVIVNRPDMAVTGAARMAAAAFNAVYGDAHDTTEYLPTETADTAARTADWRKAVRRSYGWVRPADDEFATDTPSRTALRRRMASWLRSVAVGVCVSMINIFCSAG